MGRSVGLPPQGRAAASVTASEGAAQPLVGGEVLPLWPLATVVAFGSGWHRQTLPSAARGLGQPLFTVAKGYDSPCLLCAGRSLEAKLIFVYWCSRIQRVLWALQVPDTPRKIVTFSELVKVPPGGIR